MSKVLLISNIPATYRVDLYNKLTNSEQLNVKFIFISPSNIDHKKLIWGENHNIFYRKSDFIESGSLIKTWIALLFKIIHQWPNRIVVGGIPAYFPILVLLKPFIHYSVFCWWGGTIYTEPDNWFKTTYRKIMAKFINGYFFYSKESFDYFNNIIRTVKCSFKIVGNNTRIGLALRGDLIDPSFKLKKEKDVNYIITIGFQGRHKNTIVLLKALTLLSEELLRPATIIIGDGPEIPNIKEFIKLHKLQNVRLLGNVKPDIVLQVLKDCTIFVHPSIADRWPQVFNEASLLGIPILISTRSGVSNEYTERYIENVLFDPFNPVELARKIEPLLRDEKLRSELGSYAKEIANTRDGNSVIHDFTDLLK